MDPALLAADFALGAAAFFSPCGFPMLPAYLGYYLTRGEDKGERVAHAAARGLAGGLLAALGAVLVIGAIGALAALLGAPFKARVVWLELVGGLIVLALGIAVLLGRGPRVTLALHPSTRRGALGVLSFGALYAAVAASCVAPLFVGVLVQAAAAPTLAEGMLAVGAYAAGLAVLLVILTVLVTTAQQPALALLRRLVPSIEKASGVLLTLVGAYLIAYWASVALLPMLRGTP